MATLHIVSHTHWDREWFETFQQFRLKLVRMVDDLLDLLAHDPDYRHFMLDGQMIVLEDYLAIRPEREADLRRLIQDGRIIVGPWYILPDEFLVSPEATIRNLYEGDRIARRFGPKMQIGYLPDTFGHIGQMPQILRGYGFDKACAWRGIADLPCAFWWQAPDGSRVLMGHLRESYSNARHLAGLPLERFLHNTAAARDALAPHAQSSHLLLMNGDDFMTPQSAIGKTIAACTGQLDGDTLLHSTLPAYFSGLEDTLDFERLPTVKGELRSTQRSNLLPNVLSARMWIKQHNHACETLLEKWAEPFSALASMAASNRDEVPLIREPAAALRQAWRLLMQCHPHDSICGCSIDQVHDEMRPRFDQVAQIGEEITRQSLQTLASVVDTLSAGAGLVSAVVLFNSSSGLRTDTVQAALVGVKPGQTFSLLDGDNPIQYEINAWEREVLSEMDLPPEHMQALLSEVNNGEIQGFRILGVEVQNTGTEAHIELVISDHGRPDLPAWERGRVQVETLLAQGEVNLFHVEAIRPVLAHVTFVICDVHGHGYKTIQVQAGSGSGSELAESSARVLAPGETAALENEHLRVQMQPDGTLDLLDKRSGKRYPGLHRFTDAGDRGDEYSFSPVEDDTTCHTAVRQVKLQTSSVCQALEIELDLTIPARLNPDRQTRSAEQVILPIHTRLSLFQGVPRLAFHTEIENHAEDHRLRVHFPAPFHTDTALHDGHFEIVERVIGVPDCPDCFEQPRPESPQRAFTAVRSETDGLLIANRGLPEVEVLHNAAGNSEIAVTLLRCVGWLSRGDFPERGGHAGPGLPTPGAQMQGTWSFDYAVIPFAGDGLQNAIEQAYHFQVPLRAVSAGLHAGTLPPAASLLQAAPETFIISAVKTAEDGSGWIARGYNLGEDEIRVRLQPLLPFSSAQRVDLAEKTLETLAVEEDGCVQFPVRGREIATVRFR